MDSFCIDWLLGELDILQEKGVIDKAAAQRIAAYYEPLRESEPLPARKQPSLTEKWSSPAEKRSSLTEKRSSPSEKRRAAVRVPVILSIMAAVLIAAGVISLIAYNWAAIGRGVKTGSAFALLLAAQAAGLLLFLRSPHAPRALRECIAVLWALLFGATVAFVSQIYRLPSDTCSFLFVWGASSVLLAYALRSDALFVLGLLLSAAYCCACRAEDGSVLPFYLLFASLVPYALARKHGLYIMTVLFALLLAAVLDHHVPGLWIPCSVSLAALCAAYGLARGDRLFGLSGKVALGILALLLSWHACWASGSSLAANRALLCSAAALPDALLALLLTVAAAAVPLALLRRRAGAKEPSPFLPLLAAVPCVVAALYALDFFFLRGFSLAAPAYVLLLAVCFLSLAAYTSRQSLLPLLLFCAAAVSAAIQHVVLPVAAIAASALFVEAAGQLRGRRYTPGQETLGTRVLSRSMIAGCLLYECLRGVGIPSPRTAFALAAAVPQLSLYAAFVALALLVLVRMAALRRSADVLVLGLLLCAMSFARECSVAAALVCSRVAMVVLPCAACYAFCRWQCRPGWRMYECLPYLAAFVVAACRNASGAASFRLYALLLSSGLYCYAVRAGEASLLAALFRRSGIAASAALLFVAAFSAQRYTVPRGVELAYLLLLAALSLYPALRLLAARTRFNRLPPAACVVLLAAALCSAAFAGQELRFGHVMEHVAFALALLLALDALYGAWKEARLAAANAAAVYAAALVAGRFFFGEYGLVAKGLLFIALGLAVLLLNICILRFGARAQKEDYDGKA